MAMFVRRRGNHRSLFAVSGCLHGDNSVAPEPSIKSSAQEPAALAHIGLKQRVLKSNARDIG